MKKVRVLNLQEDETKPVIVTFPQNHPSQRFLIPNEDDEDNNDLIDFDLYTHKHVKNKTMIHGHNSKFDWLGSNSGRTYKKVQGAKYVLGFYSDKSKHLNVVEVDDVFNLKQYPKDLKVPDVDDEEKKAPAIRAIEQKKLLVEEFGNTRSKRMMDALKTSIVTESKISGANEIRDILMEKAEEFKKEMDEKKEDPISSFIQSKRETLPEFNLAASTPEKIYNLHSIIPREEWEVLNVKEFQVATKKDNNLLDKIKHHLSKFVLQELEDIKNDRKTFSKDMVGSKLKCLVYLNWLIKFLEMKVVYKSAEQLSEEMKMQQINVKSILSRFFIPGNSNREQDKIVYTRNTMLTDKLICYILVLGLFYGDFELDATGLIANMKIEHKKFVKYCEEIGCNFKKKRAKGEEEEKIILKLEAPLKIKPPSNKRPKKN